MSVNTNNTVIVMASKSLIIAYILWFFLGYLGMHRFYLKSPIMAFAQIGLTILGAITWAFAIGWIFFTILGIWLFFDIFWILFRTGHLKNKEFEKIATKLS